jgi:NTE family protein
MKHNLRSIPFFSDLDDNVLEAISRRLQREHYHKDAAVFLEDEPGDCMYLIESGQIKVVSEKGSQEKIFTYLGPGNFFGEMAVLLGDRRSATARVVIDADLLVLRKNDLDELLETHPQIAVLMTQELGRRLVRSNTAVTVRDEFNIVAILGNAAPAMARHLAQVTGEQVYLLDLGGLANMTLDPVALQLANVRLVRGNDILDPEGLADRLSKLVEQFYWVLLVVAPYEIPLTLKAMELADITLQIGGKEPSWLRATMSKGFWRTEENDPALRRTARRICQRLVGIALSSGNARGIAHIGVLKVLEEEGIPIDMIAGTSAGAIFAAMFAAGRSIDEMIQFSAGVQRQYNFLTGFRYWDFCLPPRSGLIKGDKVLNYLRKWVKNKSFEQLSIPTFIIATDLISGEEIVFDHGPVAEAMRASMSVIGIMEPAHVAGRFLIDGGSVNPVPTQLLADKGISIILASNVIPGLEERLHRRELKREGKLPNIVGILLGAMEIMESEIIKSRLGPVDVLIQPDIERYATLDYDKYGEIIKRGEEAAREQIVNIKQRLAPRPRPPFSTTL